MIKVSICEFELLIKDPLTKLSNKIFLFLNYIFQKYS